MTKTINFSKSTANIFARRFGSLPFMTNESPFYFNCQTDSKKTLHIEISVGKSMFDRHCMFGMSIIVDGIVQHHLNSAFYSLDDIKRAINQIIKGTYHIKSAFHNDDDMPRVEYAKTDDVVPYVYPYIISEKFKTLTPSDR